MLLSHPLRRRRLFACVFAIAAVPIIGMAETTYTTTYKPSSLTTLYAACLDTQGYSIPGASISLANTYTANTGAHFHPTTGNHPKSTYSPDHGVADSSGNLQVQLTTTIVGQDEDTTIQCTYNGQTVQNHIYFSVGHIDIHYNDHPTIWYQVGGDTTGHGSNAYNHWMETNSAYNLYYATNDYLFLFPDTPDGKLADNDQGLPWGGIFDLNQDWNPPHEYHQRGTAADMRNNMGLYSIPVSRTNYFIRACWDHGAELAQVEYDDPNDSDTSVYDIRRHVHCHWPLIP
jgi:hypothetical protein